MRNISVDSFLDLTRKSQSYIPVEPEREFMIQPRNTLFDFYFEYVFKYE